jgi:hypothetical protein
MPEVATGPARRVDFEAQVAIVVPVVVTPQPVATGPARRTDFEADVPQT